MSKTDLVEFSIIVPAYNAREFIARALESALGQTETRIEVIVVDDASGDGTAEFVEAACHMDRRLRLLRLIDNGGPARARNHGIAQAKGDWIAILDADDAWHPERLARMLAHTHDADAVFDNLAGVDPLSGIVGASLFPVFPEGELSLARLLMPRAEGSQFDFGYLKPIMRRSFLVQHNLTYDETLRTSEDLMIYLGLVLSKARTRVIDDALYLYTLPVSQAGNVRSSQSRTRPRDRDVQAALERLRERYSDRIDEAMSELIAQRIAHLRHVAPISDFYYARQTRAYGRMAYLMARHVSVRREAISKAIARLSR